MAESVQYYLERMIPELEALEKKNIFTPVEIKSIIKKRTNFEYALQRRIKQKIDFLRAIEYEMNLEELRKKRIGRMGIADSLKGDDLQFSGARRIYSLFKRATIKFTGDISLWLQYIDYAKKNNANNILSSIFVQAIQYHPRNPSLWIMAATWENEGNSNMAAARVLLQRAIRLMPENQQLWHEYFRLELIYIEKIKLRRRILGINSKANEENLDMNVDDDDEEDDNTIQLPAITGEDVSEWKEEESSKKKSKLTEAQMAALEEENNPILQGLLAKIIYDNAIAAIPTDISFRKKFVEIYREFTDTEKHIDYIYETMERDLSDSPSAREFLAKRHLHSNITVSDPAFIPALSRSVQDFDKALQDLAESKEMWELYIQFLFGWHQLAAEENLKLYLSKLLQKNLKACQKKKLTSAKLYKLWTEYLMNDGQEVKAESIVSEGIQAYPDAVDLWIYRINFSKENQDEQRELYLDALEESPASLKLWTSYKDWIIEEAQLSIQETGELLYKACEKATLLLPSVTSESSDRNGIKQVLQASYVEWAAKTQNIEAARTVYKKIISSFYPTYSFFMKCIEIENEYGNGDRIGQESVEFLYDRIIRLDEDKEGSFIAYLAYLYSQKKLQKATQVYNRACKEVSNKEAFDIQVQKLKNQNASLLH